MLLRRIIGHFRQQEWTAIAIDFVIVVLGVVIGIQVANWNESRVLRERERALLQQLLVDLESDRATGEFGVEAADRIDDAAEALLAALEDVPQVATISDADLMRSLLHAGYAYLPQGNRATYEEMISTGALGRMRDLDLKRALGDYYRWASGGRQWDVLLRDEQFAYLASIRGLLTREQSAWARASFGASGEAGARPPAFDRGVFLERARSRPQLVDSLHSMGALQERLRNDSRDLAARAEALAARIRTELGET
jgi:hypothetical protein